jgi:hypothetical protein
MGPSGKPRGRSACPSPRCGPMPPSPSTTSRSCPIWHWNWAPDDPGDAGAPALHGPRAVRRGGADRALQPSAVLLRIQARPLVAGNAVILKAPDQAPLPALRIGELAQEALPPGLVSVVSGRARRPAARWCSIRGSGALPSSVRSDRQVGPAGRGGRRGQGRVGGAGREERDDRLRRRRSRRPGCRGRLPG